MPAGFTDFRGNRHNSLDVLQWITENVPCFTGMVPREWTQAVYAESRSRAINWEVARQAMIWASRSGYRFDFSTGVVTDAVVYMSKAEKLKAGIEHSVKYLPGNLKSVGQALVEPKALAIMVGTLLAWAFRMPSGSERSSIWSCLELASCPSVFRYSRARAS